MRPASRRGIALALISLAVSLPMIVEAQVSSAETAAVLFDFGPGQIQTGREPFALSPAVADGNYRVTVTLGATDQASTTTIHAELRRLMIDELSTAPGESKTVSFIVNVRTPAIPGTDSAVRLNGREQTSEKAAWDNNLDLAFSGDNLAVQSVRIEQARVPTIFIIGDSTVCDQPAEPYNSWGQMITQYFESSVALANHAESGESVAGALGRGRLDKIFAEMRPGDYLYMQFGHNDMKSTAANAIDRFTEDFRYVVAETRRRGGTPMLLTPVSRMSFNDAGRIENSFGEYPERVRQVAREHGVALIDLQALSAVFYESLGAENASTAFATADDGTHHNNYGSNEIARIIVNELVTRGLPGAEFIVRDFQFSR